MADYNIQVSLKRSSARGNNEKEGAAPPDPVNGRGSRRARFYGGMKDVQ